MSDCGCGSSDGNCTDNLNSNAKNAQVTGNVSYDGSAISCTNNPSIDIVSGEGLNSVIQKVLASLCNGGVSSRLLYTRSVPYLTNLTESRQDMTNSNTFTLNPNSGYPNYLGDGVRIKISVKTSPTSNPLILSTLTNNAFIKLDIFGFDGSVKTAYHTLVNRILLPGTDASAPTATSYLLTWKLESNDGSVTDGAMGLQEDIPFSLTSNKVGFSFSVGVSNNTDSIWNVTNTVELIK